MEFWNPYLRSAASVEFTRDNTANQVIGHRPWDSIIGKAHKMAAIENGSFQRANALHTVLLNGMSMVRKPLLEIFLTMGIVLFKKRFLSV